MAAVCGQETRLTVWNRPYIRRLRTGRLGWQEASEVMGRMLASTQVRVLSVDDAAGARTCLWRIPAGWCAPAPWCSAADMQFLVLEGQLDCSDFSAGPLGYAHIPAQLPLRQLHSADGALVLAMWDAPLRPADEGPGAQPRPAVIHIGKEALYPTPVAGPAPGIIVKVLREDANTGGMTLYIEIPPGWTESRSEHHDCVEESYKLAGEITLAEDGIEHTLVAGDYFYRPPYIKHGPMYSRTGTASLIRFSGKPVNHYGPLAPTETLSNAAGLR